MTPFLASPARDSQIAGRSKGLSSHESEAEFIEMHKTRWYLIFTALCPVECFMSRGWLFADCDDEKRHPHDGLSGAVFMMDGWVGRQHS